MSFDNKPPDTIPRQSLESSRETYAQRLDTILNKQLTIENVETFADDALSETMQLIRDLLVQYGKNPPYTREEEDDAFKLVGLPDIQDILQSIINVKDEVDGIKKYIDTNTKDTNEVITPPQLDYPAEITGRQGEGIEKKMFPRLLTLLYIIKHDFDISPTAVSITKGLVTPTMVRLTPYVRVEVNDLDRVIYICDEEGNASYIFDTIKLETLNLTLSEMDTYDKGAINSLIVRYPGIGIRLSQSSKWRTRVAEALRESIPEITTDSEEKNDKAERGNISEFKGERGSKWLSFNNFQNEVKDLFKGEKNVFRWYKVEQKNHPNWPSNPNDTYIDKGWVGWIELVDRKNPFPAFDDFQNEVREFHHEEGDVGRWYNKEQKNHPNWPTHPAGVYKDKGWIGLPELIGKVSPFSTFDDFKNEVRSLFQGEGDVNKWYQVERKNHPNWPTKPEKIYKGQGWIGLPELVGKKNRLKKK